MHLSQYYPSILSRSLANLVRPCTENEPRLCALEARPSIALDTDVRRGVERSPSDIDRGGIPTSELPVRERDDSGAGKSRQGCGRCTRQHPPAGKRANEESGRRRVGRSWAELSLCPWATAVWIGRLGT